VGDVAAAVLAALDNASVASGQVFNVGDLTTGTVRDWALAILAAAGSSASLVTVPEDLVPPDLEDTRSIAQHFLVDSRKAATLLGWRPSDPADTIPVSVRWHLENPPAEVDEDFSADDRALAARPLTVSDLRLLPTFLAPDCPRRTPPEGPRIP
jgi:hypothetical protein